MNNHILYFMGYNRSVSLPCNAIPCSAGVYFDEHFQKFSTIFLKIKASILGAFGEQMKGVLKTLQVRFSKENFLFALRKNPGARPYGRTLGFGYVESRIMQLGCRPFRRRPLSAETSGWNPTRAGYGRCAESDSEPFKIITRFTALMIFGLKFCTLKCTPVRFGMGLSRFFGGGQ